MEKRRGENPRSFIDIRWNSKVEGRIAFDVAHGYKSEMVACGRLSGQAERKRALRLHLLPVNLETTPSLPRVELCWRWSNRVEAWKRKDNWVYKEKSWEAKRRNNDDSWKGVENFIHSFFYSSFFFSTWLLDFWFLVFIHRNVWILSFWCGFYPSLHRVSSRSCYGRKDVFSFFDHPWFKWIRDEVGLSARHIHVDLCVSSLNGAFHDVFLTMEIWMMMKGNLFGWK